VTAEKHARFRSGKVGPVQFDSDQRSISKEIERSLKCMDFKQAFDSVWEHRRY